METAARIQNDAELLRYMRAHAVRIAARRRLRGFSPAMDRMLHPYAFSDVEESEIITLLLHPHPLSTLCYRHRHGAAAAIGLLLSAAVWYVSHALL